MYHDHEPLSVPSPRRRAPRIDGVDVDLVVGALVVLGLALWLLAGRSAGPDPLPAVTFGPLLTVAGAAAGLERARWGRGRGARTVRFDATGVVLIATAVLLPPAWFPLVALAASLDADRRRAALNTCVRTIAVCMAALTVQAYAGVLPQLPLAPGTARVVELVVAGAALLLTEVALVHRHLRLSDSLGDEVPGLLAAVVHRDAPPLSLGAVACVLLAVSPPAVLLLVPLVLLVVRGLRDQEALLDAGLDAKTGLLRLETFAPLAEAEVARARRHDRSLALLMLDLDGMKSVNTEYGHPEGERVIEALGGLLTGAMRTEDVVARYGGDEFALLLPDTDVAGATVLADRVRALIGSSVLLPVDPPVRRTASVGVAALRPDDTIESLIERADVGLRRAKAEGRDRVVVVEPAAGPAVAA
jgi:diguanylate cyclase (GGDEF)-like protein